MSNSLKGSSELTPITNGKMARAKQQKRKNDVCHI